MGKAKIKQQTMFIVSKQVQYVIVPLTDTSNYYASFDHPFIVPGDGGDLAVAAQVQHESGRTHLYPLACARRLADAALNQLEDLCQWLKADIHHDVMNPPEAEQSSDREQACKTSSQIKPEATSDEEKASIEIKEADDFEKNKATDSTDKEETYVPADGGCTVNDSERACRTEPPLLPERTGKGDSGDTTFQPIMKTDVDNRNLKEEDATTSLERLYKQHDVKGCAGCGMKCPALMLAAEGHRLICPDCRFGD